MVLSSAELTRSSESRSQTEILEHMSSLIDKLFEKLAEVDKRYPRQSLERKWSPPISLIESSTEVVDQLQIPTADCIVPPTQVVVVDMDSGSELQDEDSSPFLDDHVSLVPHLVSEFSENVGFNPSPVFSTSKVLAEVHDSKFSVPILLSDDEYGFADGICVESGLMTSYGGLDGDISFCTSTICQNVYGRFLLDILSYMRLEVWDIFWSPVTVFWLDKPPPFPPDNTRHITLSYWSFSDFVSGIIAMGKKTQVLHTEENVLWFMSSLSFDNVLGKKENMIRGRVTFDTTVETDDIEINLAIMPFLPLIECCVQCSPFIDVVWRNENRLITLTRIQRIDSDETASWVTVDFLPYMLTVTRIGKRIVLNTNMTLSLYLSMKHVPSLVIFTMSKYLHVCCPQDNDVKFEILVGCFVSFSSTIYSSVIVSKRRLFSLCLLFIRLTLSSITVAEVNTFGKEMDFEQSLLSAENGQLVDSIEFFSLQCLNALSLDNWAVIGVLLVEDWFDRPPSIPLDISQSIVFYNGVHFWVEFDETSENECPYFYWSSNCVSSRVNMFICHEMVNEKLHQWVTKPLPLAPEIIENVLRYLRIHCLTLSLRIDEFHDSIFAYMEYGWTGVGIIQPLEIFRGKSTMSLGTYDMYSHWERKTHLFFIGKSFSGVGLGTHLICIDGYGCSDIMKEIRWLMRTDVVGKMLINLHFSAYDNIQGEFPFAGILAPFNNTLLCWLVDESLSDGEKKFFRGVFISKYGLCSTHLSFLLCVFVQSTLKRNFFLFEFWWVGEYAHTSQQQDFAIEHDKFFTRTEMNNKLLRLHLNNLFVWNSREPPWTLGCLPDHTFLMKWCLVFGLLHCLHILRATDYYRIGGGRQQTSIFELRRTYAIEVFCFLKKLKLLALPSTEEDAVLFHICVLFGLFLQEGAWMGFEFLHLMQDMAIWSSVLIMAQPAIGEQFKGKFDKQWNVGTFYALASRFNKRLWFDSDYKPHTMRQCLVLCAYGGREYVEHEQPNRNVILFCGGEVFSCQFSGSIEGLVGHSSIHFKCLPFPSDNNPPNEVAPKQEEVVGRWVYSNKMAYKLELPPQAKICCVFHVSLNQKDSSKLTAILNRRMIIKDVTSVLQFLIQWNEDSKENATWEYASCIQELFPTFNIEDDVSFEGVGIDPSNAGIEESERARYRIPSRKYPLREYAK